MKILNNTIACLLILTSTAAWSDREKDHDEARRLRLEGKILPLSIILVEAEKAGMETILEAELEKENHQWLYEIEGLSNHKEWLELTIDASTGKILSIEKKRSKRKHN